MCATLAHLTKTELFRLKIAFCFRDIHIFTLVSSPHPSPVGHCKRSGLKINFNVHDIIISVSKNLKTHLGKSLSFDFRTWSSRATKRILRK